jgi:AraC family transcriptional regulator of adaptative response/methylated-DNA-[protein]-cysteine methyltransferase
MANQATRAAQRRMETEQDPRWRAVRDRDASERGYFVYGVRTSGVYCHPGCASRRPLPENVSFHVTPADAESAGLRPCKRCRPRDAAAGAEAVRYTLSPSSLGQVLVASTSRGVRAVMLGEDGEALVGELRARFPAATPGDDVESQALAAAVVARVEAPAGTALPALDLRGTDFQRQVWAALAAIPAGTTASYAELARRIGRPRAVRAVCSACGANPLAVLVPCHRAVGSSGALTGYRWGLERKRVLLRREAESAVAHAA